MLPHVFNVSPTLRVGNGTAGTQFVPAVLFFWYELRLL